MTNSILIFTKIGCPYCKKAKDFFNSLNLPYQETILDPNDPNYVSKRDNLFNNTGHRSYPIIYIGNQFVGGYSELVHSYNTLKLHKMCANIGLHVPFDF
jgi:glutaredoxin